MRIGLPIETAVRELDGKLWLALNLADGGHEVIIGKTPSIYQSIDVYGPDIMIVSGYFGENTGSKPISKYRKSGCYTIYLDTEGGVYKTEQDYFDRIYPDPSTSVDHIFSWGPKPAKVAKEAAGESTKVNVTGNPRFDLLQDPYREIYSDRCEHISEKYDPFILFNTNFTRGNHQKDEPLTEATDIGDIRSSSDWNATMCHEFIKCIKYISENTESFDIIIRPHPSENHDTYKNIFKDYRNIHVKCFGDVRNWIAATQAVVHNSCTTGIEAALMDKPVFTYRPMPSEYEISLPNEISIDTRSKEELLNYIYRCEKHMSKNTSLTQRKKSKISEYIWNFDTLSVNKISEIINDIESGRYNGSFTPTGRERIKRFIIGVVGDKNITRIRETGFKNHWSYSNQKFPYISSEEIKSRLETLSTYGEFGKLEANRIRKVENGFVIKQA